MKRIISFVLMLLVVFPVCTAFASCDVFGGKAEWYGRDDGDTEYYVSINEKDEEMTVIVSEGKKYVYYVFDCEIDDDEVKIKDAGKNKETYSFKLKEGSSVTIDGVKFKSTDDAPDLDDCKKGKNSLTVYELLGKLGKEVLIGKYIGTSSLTNSSVCEYFADGTFVIYKLGSGDITVRGTYEINEDQMIITQESGYSQYFIFEYRDDGSFLLSGMEYVKYEEHEGEQTGGIEYPLGPSDTNSSARPEDRPSQTETANDTYKEDVPGDDNGDGMIDFDFQIISNLAHDDYSYREEHCLIGARSSLSGGHTVAEALREVIFDFDITEFELSKDGTIRKLSTEFEIFEAGVSFVNEETVEDRGNHSVCYYEETAWNCYVNGEKIDSINNYFVSDGDFIELIFDSDFMEKPVDVLAIDLCMTMYYDANTDTDCYHEFFYGTIYIPRNDLTSGNLIDIEPFVFEKFDVDMEFASETQIESVAFRTNEGSMQPIGTFYSLTQNRPVTGERLPDGMMEFYADKAMWTATIVDRYGNLIYSLENNAVISIDYVIDRQSTERIEIMYPDF